MGGFGKVAGIGLASVFALLLAISAAGVVFAMPIPGPLTVVIDEAEITGLTMYGGAYVGGPFTQAEIVEQGNWAPVVVQEIDSMWCPYGQTIIRSVSVLGVTVTAEVSMGTASLTNVFMKADSVYSSEGELTAVEMETAPEPEGLYQTMAYGVLYGLVSEVYFVSLDSLVYTDLSITLRVH